jgi:hypothetical protein
VSRLRSHPVRLMVAACLNLLLLAAAPATGHSLSGPVPTVTITARSGYAGHGFVYAQVTDSIFAFPAPTGRDHQSPYYSEWVAQPVAIPSCPWVWAVYVFNRATNQQINIAPANAPSPNFGTTTLLCANPTRTPVEQPAVAHAEARLDLDLSVSVAPRPVAGSTTNVAATLSGRLTEDLNLFLSMAIEEWSVSRWSLDFGDGQAVTISAPVANTISLPHIYAATGPYDARAVASIRGHAQAAIYDRYGNVQLIRKPFSVEVGNHTSVTPRALPVRVYLPPRAVVAVNPVLAAASGRITHAVPSFRRVDVLRGALTNFAVRLQVTQEGRLVINGRPGGWGESRLLSWRYDGPSSDAPAGSSTRPGRFYAAAEPLRLQWNSPGLVVGGRPQDYVVPITLQLETRYPDEHLARYVIASTFSVSINFAAQSG